MADAAPVAMFRRCIRLILTRKQTAATSMCVPSWRSCADYGRRPDVLLVERTLVQVSCVPALAVFVQDVMSARSRDRRRFRAFVWLWVSVDLPSCRRFD